MRFKDKSVIITGGGGKIGKAYAVAFAKEGAKVSLPDIAAPIMWSKQFEISAGRP